MAKYQWGNANLQRKMQNYQWLMLICALVALGLYFLEVSVYALMAPVVLAVVFYVLAWRLKNRDTRLKRGN